MAPRGSDVVADAVRAGGGELVGLDESPDALVWMAPDDVIGLHSPMRLMSQTMS